MSHRFTYSILRASASPDDVEELGDINEAAATELLSTFPFACELAKREQNPQLMVPTITFLRTADERYFSVWSERSGEWVVYCPEVGVAEGIQDFADIRDCMRCFFASDDTSLSRLLVALKEKYSAGS